MVKAPGDSTLPLRSGDVILVIGGRRPTSPSHAMRILRSYEGGETVTIEILRKKKHSTVCVAGTAIRRPACARSCGCTGSSPTQRLPETDGYLRRRAAGSTWSKAVNSKGLGM